MEVSHRERLSELVEQLTTSGQSQLDESKIKEVKKICRMSNDCIDHLYHTVMSQLNQDHAEIRLSAFQIASELFGRSHYFRTLLVDNFQEFLELTVETDSEQPLPPPQEVARKLRSLAIQTVQSWQASYGTAYKKLALGYHFLKQVKKVDFQDAEARTVAERRREEEHQRRRRAMYREKVEAAAKDMEESYQEIQSTLTQMESCMRLLSSEFEPLHIHTPSSSSTNSQQTNKQQFSEELPCCSKDWKEPPGEDGKVEGREETSRSAAKEGKTSSGDGGTIEELVKTSSSEGGGSPVEEEEEEEDEGSEGEEEASGVFIRSSGLITHCYNLDLEISPGLHIQETDDNEAVVSTVMDLHRLMETKYLPAVRGWCQVFTKSAAEQQLLQRALDLKGALVAALEKHRELQIDYRTRERKVVKASSPANDDSDNDDDFDEVPEKEGYEPHIPEHLRAEYGLEPMPSTSTAPATSRAPATRTSAAPALASAASRLKRRMEEEQDPTSAAATLRHLRQRMALQADPGCSSSVPTPAQSNSDKKSNDVPVVPFGLDLYYWGQEQPNAGKIIKLASQHQFWAHAPIEEESENKELLAESRSRYISFPGSFVPVTHHCRARLANGSLCPRQDRHKCPFHGRIIARDNEGRPLSEEDRRREEQEARKRREEQTDWRDTELMRDIEAATGKDLGSERVVEKGKKKKKKKKFPNLSDLKQNTNTSRSRLEKKVLNKTTLRRIAAVMSKVDRRKHDKFSNQFNYALN